MNLYYRAQYDDLGDWLSFLRDSGWDGPLIDQLTVSLANRLSSDSSAFSRELFYKAAGYGGLGEIRAPKGNRRD